MFVIKKVLNAFSSTSVLSFEQAQWLSLFENHLRSRHVSLTDLEACGITKFELVNQYGLSYDPSIAARIAASEIRSELLGEPPASSDQLQVEEIVIDATPLPSCFAA